MILIATLFIIFLGFLSGEEEVGLAIAILAAVYLSQRSFNLQIQDLKSQISKLSEQIAQLKLPRTTTEKTQPSIVESENPVFSKVETVSAPEPELDDEFPELDELAWASTEKHTAQDNFLERRVKQAIQYALSWFTDGNVFVRVGLLVLFVGVAFLLKYAAENSRIPLEIRFIGAALGGLVLITLGWRLRFKKEVFSLLLQGGGIGIIYITIFASYRIANLIPSTLTFVLLVVFALITAALAVLQNARSLAMYAVLGGFIAPILASSGSGNYIGLFGYYAVLNLVVFSIAWFKAWRLLNLIGFVFTFSVYAVWFVLSYRQEMLVPAALFLSIFFIMYSVLGILYALKQTHNLRGLVDGTLVFGAPLISSSIAMAMLRHLEYGIALCSLMLGLYYVLMARFLWQRIGEQTKLLAEALLAIGVVFTTLAIPYALDGHWSSATWALEAAGILWVSIRQNRRYAQIFAMLLQVGSGVLFLFSNAHDLGKMVWMNPAFLGGTFIALGALISARLLYQIDKQDILHRLHWLFYIWGMGWWLVSALTQIEHYLPFQIFAVLLLILLTSALLFYLDRIRQWNWLPASIQLALVIPVLFFLVLLSLIDNDHVLIWPDISGWLAVIVLSYYILLKLETIAWKPSIFITLYSGLMLLVVGVLSIELYWKFDWLLPSSGAAYISMVTVFPLLAIWWIRKGEHAVFERWGVSLQQSMTASLLVVLILWSLISNLHNTGDSTPLPYMPLLNALDLAHLVLFISMFRSIKMFELLEPKFKIGLLATLGGLVFIWISALFLRSMHHYSGIVFDLNRMLNNDSVQTGLSILWTLIGMLTILFASRRSLRVLWITGAVLVGIVIIKLIFADLRAIGTVERIVSFLVVGGLLVAMGYFSPIPPKKDNDEVVSEVVKNG